MTSGDTRRPFDKTLPLFRANSTRPIAPDPNDALRSLAPSNVRLLDLENSAPIGAERPARRSTPSRRTARQSLPPSPPPWMQAARMVSQAMEQLVAQAQASPSEQAAVARTFDALNLGQVTERTLLRVAHLATRARRAIRESARRDTETAVRDCAGVLHSGLPSNLQRRVPIERVILVVRHLRDTEDPWTAVVDATSDLVGWMDLCRRHAAIALRQALERNR